MRTVLKVSTRKRVISPRFFSKAVLVVTILPLWALWFYAYATLRSLQSEVETLPRFYGMYLYKANAQSRLEEAARRIDRFVEEKGRNGEGVGAEALTEEALERFGLVFGLEEVMIVVKRAGLRILHPFDPPYGSAEFLGDPEGRAAFLRTLQKMDANGLRGGYFAIDSLDSPDGADKQCWFLAMSPVGEDLLCVLSVPEEQVRLSGGILEEAKGTLLEERRKRFVRLTLPVVVLSSLFIVLLYRQSRQPHRGSVA
jgi:hypothetical protein